MRRSRLPWAIALGLVISAPLAARTVGWRQQISRDVPAAVTAVSAEMLSRQRANGELSLLVSLVPSTGQLDEVRAELPSDKKLNTGHLPEGWMAEQRGRQVRAWGPSRSDVDLRFELPAGNDKDYAGRKAKLQCSHRGRSLLNVELSIVDIGKLEVTSSLEGILTLPPQGTPGQPMLIGVTDAYRRGTWRFSGGGATTPLMPLEYLSNPDRSTAILSKALLDLQGTDVLKTLLDKPAPRPFIWMFDPMIDRAVFTDRWNETTVDAKLTITAVPPASCPRRVTAGSAFTFAGQAACVSGCFPDLTSAYGFKLDGGPDLTPWAVSPTTVMFGIPEKTTPGPHTISAPGAVGSVTVGVLGLEGSIDQTKLWTGDATTMRLRILGTDRAIPILVLNRTPSVISIDGGIRQVINTPGGADNGITREVRGIHRGNFNILYSVNFPACGGAQPPSPRP